MVGGGVVKVQISLPIFTNNPGVRNITYTYQEHRSSNQEERMPLKDLPENIKCIILDMDGVLVDTEPLHIQAFAKYMDALGLKYEPEYIHGFVGYSIEDNVKRINREFLAGREVEVSRGVMERDRIYLDLIRSTPLKPMPGIMDMFNLCRERRWKIALASSSSREQISIILENLALNGYPVEERLDLIVSGDDVTNRKPYGDIYHKVLTCLSCGGAYAIAVEDSGAGVQSTKAAGIYCVAVTSPYVSREQLAEADMLVDSVQDLVGLLRRKG